MFLFICHCYSCYWSPLHYLFWIHHNSECYFCLCMSLDSRKRPSSIHIVCSAVTAVETVTQLSHTVNKMDKTRSRSLTPFLSLCFFFSLSISLPLIFNPSPLFLSLKPTHTDPCRDKDRHGRGSRSFQEMSITGSLPQINPLYTLIHLNRCQ